jgi:predicted kinase
MKMIITKGLPASGKSTWAKEYVSNNDQWVRINRDDLRNMRGKYWVPSQEDLITQWEDWCVLLALNHGYHVVLDATNLNDSRTKARIDSYKEQHKDLKTDVKWFKTPLEECIARDNKRENGVGEKVIRGMYEKYLKPEPPKYDEDDSLPKCIICDIDGTLAEMGNRSPFEWDKVGLDTLKEPVADIANRMAIDNVVFVFSGRDGSCRKETEEWLEDNGVLYDELIMREAGDQTADEKVKRQMFEDHVRGKYYCNLVLDDRDKVVRMWREDLGLTCLQVDYGNF